MIQDSNSVPSNKIIEGIKELYRPNTSSIEKATLGQQLLITKDEGGLKKIQVLLSELRKSQLEQSFTFIIIDNKTNLKEEKQGNFSDVDTIFLKGFNTDDLLLLQKIQKSDEFQINLLDEIEEIIEKAGEGSRGGKVIGHTKSGKPVYEVRTAKHDKEYNSQDHNDAAYLHLDHATKLTKEGKREQAETHNELFDSHMSTSRHKKANEELDKESQTTTKSKQSQKIQKSESQTQDFFGTNVHQQQSLQKAHLLQSFQSENTPYDLLEKGGKRATIGEVRTWGNEKWVKHQDGWVHVHPKTGKATIEKPGGKRETASEEHIQHHKIHIDRKDRESLTKQGQKQAELMDEGYSEVDADRIANGKLNKETKKMDEVDDNLNYNELSKQILEDVYSPSLRDKILSTKEYKEAYDKQLKLEEDGDKEDGIAYTPTRGTLYQQRALHSILVDRVREKIKSTNNEKNLEELSEQKDKYSNIIFKEHGSIPSERKYLKTNEGKDAWDKYNYYTNEIAKRGKLKTQNLHND